MKDEMGEAYSTHSRNEKYVQHFSQKIQKEEISWDRWEDNIKMFL
jgi:hypothetical protein